MKAGKGWSRSGMTETEMFAITFHIEKIRVSCFPMIKYGKSRFPENPLPP